MIFQWTFFIIRKMKFLCKYFITMKTYVCSRVRKTMQRKRLHIYSRRYIWAIHRISMLEVLSDFYSNNSDFFFTEVLFEIHRKNQILLRIPLGILFGRLHSMNHIFKHKSIMDKQFSRTRKETRDSEKE